MKNNGKKKGGIEELRKEKNLKLELFYEQAKKRI
jgi:hypothetical protein